jgi:hypothetical protein
MTLQLKRATDCDQRLCNLWRYYGRFPERKALAKSMTNISSEACRVTFANDAVTTVDVEYEKTARSPFWIGFLDSLNI